MADDIKRSSTSRESEDFGHSAILAKHGISYNICDEKEKNTPKDGADRILDALDQQLGDFMFPRLHSDDVNDDPGTDIESVRSLRDRVMSDLAANQHQNSTKDSRTLSRDGHEGSSTFQRTYPGHRSSSASRFKKRDSAVSDDLPIATKKALASSLDRLSIDNEKDHPPSISSARVPSNYRRGRDHERLCDRKRANDAQNSWGTPSTLSIRDLTDSSSKSIPHSLSQSNASSRHKRLNSSMASVGLPFQSPKWEERGFQYHKRSVSARPYSTPVGFVTEENLPPTRSPKLSMEDRKYFKRVEYDDDFKIEYKNPKFPSPEKNKNLTVSKENGKSLAKSRSSSSEIAEDESSKTSLSDNMARHIVHQLSTPEKRDQYEWRMRKMLTELKMPENQIVGLFNDKYQASQEKNRPVLQDNAHGSKIENIHKDAVTISDIEVKSDEVSKDSDQITSNHPAVSKLYSKTDYHEIPTFATSNLSGKTTTSSLTNHSFETCNVNMRENKHASLGEGQLQSDVSREICISDLKQSKNTLPKNSVSTDASSNSESRSSQHGDGARKVSSHGTFPSESDLSPDSDDRSCHISHSHPITENNDVVDAATDSESARKSVGSAEDVYQNKDTKDNKNITLRDSVSSAQSDSTLVADSSDTIDKYSTEKSDDAINILETVNKISGKDSATTNPSTTDIDSLATSEFESKYHERQKRFPETKLANGKPDTGERMDKPRGISNQLQKKLTYRDRMKIALSARKRRVDRAFGPSDIKESLTPRRRHSLGSDSLATITTDELVAANPDGSNLRHIVPQNSKGGRSNLPRSSSVTSLSTVHTEEYEDKYKHMMVRHVAGVPVTSFDGVTIASDLDSVHTDAVREHFKESLRKSKGPKSTSSADSARPQVQDTKSLRDRYNRLKENEKKWSTTNGKDIDASYSTRPPLSRVKPSYQTATYDGNSDNGLDVSKPSQNNESMDSLLSHNGFTSEHRTSPASKHSVESRRQPHDVTSSVHSSSKDSARHNRTRSVGPPSRRNRTLESSNVYMVNGCESFGSIEPAKSIARRSHRSESVESGNDRHHLTSTALSKLKQLDSQIDAIENKKKSSEQELKLMEKTIEGHRISLLKLEEKLRENQAKADDARTELMVLEFKKDQCKKELDSTTKELSNAQERIHDADDLGMTYDDIVALIQERDDLRARFRRGEASKTTIAERQELERALHTAREELFRERKFKREQMEEMEEKLEEVEHNFETMEEEKKLEVLRLKEIIHELEKKENDTISQSKTEERVNAIESEKKSLLGKIENLGHQMQEKDKEIVSLATESNRSREENQRLKEKLIEMDSKVVEQITLREKLIAEAERNASSLRKEKELAIASVKGQNQTEIEKVLQDIEREKSRAILDSKSEHQEEICKMRAVIENKDKEIEKLRERLYQEEDAKRELADKLRREAQEQIRTVLEKERSDWEKEKEVFNQREDNIRKAKFEKEKTQLALDVEEAKNKCKIATDQISRLRTEIEDLRLENRKQLQEKLDSVSHAREQERKDQAKKYEQLKQELTELNEAELTNQRNKFSKLEEELRNVKQEKHDALLKCKEADSQADRSERCLIAEIHDECLKIADLIRGIRTPSQSRNRSAIASRSGSHLSRSNRPVNSEGCVSQLRALSDDVRATLRDLTTEVETHRRAAQIAQRERNQVLSSGSNSSSKHLSQQIAELNGHNSHDIKALSKQLADKDNELRDIQRSMSLWKDTTAQKLAEKFEEELALQLERKLSRHRYDHKRQLERMEEDIAKLSASTNGHVSIHPDFDASASLVAPISSTPAKVLPQGSATGEKGTVKLLRHLQGRVKQLRAENDLLRSNSQILDYDGLRKSR